MLFIYMSNKHITQSFSYSAYTNYIKKCIQFELLIFEFYEKEEQITKEKFINEIKNLLLSRDNFFLEIHTFYIPLYIDLFIELNEPIFVDNFVYIKIPNIFFDYIDTRLIGNIRLCMKKFTNKFSYDVYLSLNELDDSNLNSSNLMNIQYLQYNDGSPIYNNYCYYTLNNLYNVKIKKNYL